MGGHPSADELLDAMEGSGASVSRATVFNALDDLTDARLVMRAGAGPGAARYEAATELHHHFVCRECGSVADVPCHGPATCLDPADIDGVVEESQVVFRGICRSCLDKQVAHLR